MEIQKDARPINILLVEDDDEDVDLMKRVLKRDRFANSLSRVSDGIEAMDYLRRQGPHIEAVRPDLILLDLNMPRMDGRQVLKEVKKDEALHTIPIVVFTSSDDERDIMASYEYKANSFVTKPVDLGEFRSILLEIQNYWFCVVALPPGKS